MKRDVYMEQVCLTSDLTRLHKWQRMQKELFKSVQRDTNSIPSQIELDKLEKFIDEIKLKV